MFCVNIAVIIPVFCVEADIGVSILTNVIIVTLVRANRNNYKVTAETIFLSVVPLTQSVKARSELIGRMTHSGVTISEANDQ